MTRNLSLEPGYVKSNIAQKYGGTTDAGAAAALRFHQAQAAVSQSVVGLTDAILTNLAPALSPLLLDLADWISKGRKSQFVTHDLAQDVRDFGTWLKQIDFTEVLKDVKEFGTEAKRVWDTLLGWKHTLDAVLPGSGGAGSGGAATPPPPGYVGTQGDVRAGHPTWLGRFLYDHFDRLRQPDNWLSNPGNPNADIPTSADQNSRLAQAMAYFQAQGRTRAQAPGMAANISAESSWNTTAFGDHGEAFGLGQWHAAWQQQFAKMFGHDIKQSSFEEQLKFYNQTAGSALAPDQSAFQAAQAISQVYERPKDDDGGVAYSRGLRAMKIFDTAPNVTVAGPAASPGAAAANSKMDVNITHNMPGARVTAHTTGNVNPPRVAAVMPGASVTTGDLY